MSNYQARSVYIMHHLGPQLGVWFIQVSTFSSVLINRFHCITSNLFAELNEINMSVIIHALQLTLADFSTGKSSGK